MEFCLKNVWNMLANCVNHEINKQKKVKIKRYELLFTKK